MLDTLFMQIIDMTKAGSIVILFVLLVRLFLKRAPKIFSYVLWATVLFRLLCPVSIESNVSLFAAFDAPAEKNAPLHTETAVNRDAPIIVPPAAFGDAAHGVQTQNTVPPLAPAKMQAEADAAAWVWLGGVLAMAVYGGASYLRLRRRLLTASPLRENIYLADHIPTPFVMGLLRPRIYLPSELGEEEYKYILLHERHHIRRGDHIIKMLAFAALALHWFNPLAWVAFVCAARDMEMSCDEAVVKKLGGGVLPDYAASLLHLATGRRVIALAPLAFGEGDTKERVRNLARWKKPALWVVVLGVAVCVILTACLATDPAGETAEEARDGYYLLIGADGVESIEIKIRGMKTGGVVNADGSLFEKGEKVWLEPLDGVTDLRGVSIAALSVRSEIIYSLSIPENAASDEVINIIAADGWLLVPGGFVPPKDAPAWDDALLEKYVDIAALPALDMAIEERYVFDDRVLLMEDSIDNELEQVVFEYYYCISSAQFDRLMGLVGENEVLQITAKNEQKNFDEGIYMSEYVLHELEVLPAEEVKKGHQHAKDDIAARIAEHDLASYALVSVDHSFKHNELSASMGPQLTDGRYMRYWLLGKAASDTEYKLYEVFWDNFTNGESDVFPPAQGGEDPSVTTVKWTYSPMMSATWHAAFHFNFDLSDYSHIEASCDNGSLWNLHAQGQPRDKTMRFEQGEPLCWMPGDGDELTNTAENAKVTFTVYDGGEIVTNGVLVIVRTGEENGQSFYEARLTETQLLALVQETGSLGAAVVMAENGTLVSYADVNHNHINEEVYVRTIEPNMIYELTVVEEGEVLYSAQAGLAHAGWNTVMLYYEDGQDYLVEYQPSMFQGDGVYHYVIFSLDGGERVVKEESSVDFSLPLEKRPDMDAFARRMNILLRNSSVLLSTEQGILVDDWAEASSLPQLYPVRFDPDEIWTAINGERGGEITANAVRLPTAPLLLQFLSGAGGWATLLTMQPDGSFTGVYSDADMGSGAAEYPNGTYYVSDFAGRFEDIERISDTMWTMRLGGLTYENEVGETWVEDGMLHIASDAHGIAGGEEFLLCAPLTPIDDLPAECRSWHPEAYRWRQGERELLQGWAVCNLNTGTAFFSEGIFS